MTRRLMRLVLVVVAAALAVGACDTGSDERDAGPRTTTTAAAAPATSTTGPADALVMDWKETFETRLPNGWLIRDCEGDRLNVCVYDGKRFVGDIELTPGYPLAREDSGKDPQEVARKLANDMITHFRKDRAEGCAAFTFEGETVRDATVGAKPGARSGFTLTDNEGRVVERVINYYLVVGDTYAIINTDAYVDDGGCLGPTEYDPTFAPSDMAKLEPYLDQLVAATPTSVTAP